MAIVEPATESEGAEPVECWCCGHPFREAELIRLGRHPEVGVCAGCAHFLYQRARARADALSRSPAARVRDGLRAARQVVIQREWHRNPIIGRALRRLGRYLP